jgi:hypothetical protein
MLFDGAQIVTQPTCNLCQRATLSDKNACKGTSHVVPGASDLAVSEMGLESSIAIVTILAFAFLDVRPQNVAIGWLIGKVTFQKFEESWSKSRWKMPNGV